jgi:hypothetical protein
MKVGIITFHSAHNVGASLQVYALQEYLIKNNCNVEIINYRIPEIDNVYKLVKFKPKSKNQSKWLTKMVYLKKYIRLLIKDKNKYKITKYKKLRNL